jgi:NAD(P)-dependent dehydrogenase (short-subunit alcohol dehydrogenase family)
VVSDLDHTLIEADGESLLAGDCLRQLHQNNSERKPPLEMVPAGRFSRAEEVARAVPFLADPASGYITGTNIKVSGGYLI